MTEIRGDGPTAANERLLQNLTAALAPAPAEPPLQGLAMLREEVAARASWPAIPASAPAAARAALISEPPHADRLRAWARRTRRAWVASAVVGGVLVTGTGVAFAAGASLPEPVRAVAYDIGLPVTSPKLEAAQHAENVLRSDLSDATGEGSDGANGGPNPQGSGSPPPTTVAGAGAGAGPTTSTTASAAQARSETKAITAAGNQLAARLAKLNAADRSKAGDEPWQLLSELQQFEAARGLPLTPLPSGSPVPTHHQVPSPQPTYPDHGPPTTGPSRTNPTNPTNPGGYHHGSPPTTTPPATTPGGSGGPQFPPRHSGPVSTIPLGDPSSPSTTAPSGSGHVSGAAYQPASGQPASGSDQKRSRHP